MDKRDRIRGAMIGCAAGDALGYPVKVLSEAAIVERYGLRGITAYDLDENGTARITADTQLMLLSANGILFAHTRGALRGIMAPVYQYFDAFYMDWYRLQTEKQPRRARCGWINAYPALSAKRAPSPTSMRVFSSDKFGSMDKPVNDSKGSGCLLRAAPIGLSYSDDPAYILDLAANTAALTHGNEVTWVASGVLALIISLIIHQELSIAEAVNETLKALDKSFPDSRKAVHELLSSIWSARPLATSASSDLDAIHALGEGWVSNEALAIGILCALRYENDIAGAMTFAANHGGNSSTTAAIAGMLVGARIGFNAIPDRFVDRLELVDVILELADDVTTDCPMSDWGPSNPVWEHKYIYEDYAYWRRRTPEAKEDKDDKEGEAKQTN
nr:ADP-ribosylglycohydrolase family protein [Schaalia odontolytica]